MDQLLFSSQLGPSLLRVSNNSKFKKSSLNIAKLLTERYPSIKWRDFNFKNLFFNLIENIPDNTKFVYNGIPFTYVRVAHSKYYDYLYNEDLDLKIIFSELHTCFSLFKEGAQANYYDPNSFYTYYSLYMLGQKGSSELRKNISKIILPKPSTSGFNSKFDLLLFVTNRLPSFSFNKSPKSNIYTVLLGNYLTCNGVIDCLFNKTINCGLKSHSFGFDSDVDELREGLKNNIAYMEEIPKDLDNVVFKDVFKQDIQGFFYQLHRFITYWEINLKNDVSLQTYLGLTKDEFELLENDPSFESLRLKLMEN